MIRVAAIQIAPVFLNKEETWNKLDTYIREAKSKGAEFVTWGETLIPGYPSGSLRLAEHVSMMLTRRQPGSH